MEPASNEMRVKVPDRLFWLERLEGGRAWLDSLPDLISRARERFQISALGQPFEGGNVSLVIPAERNGEEVVLKLQFVHRETRFEADALSRWDGNGAIRLLDHAPELGALLLERCRPGQLLAESEDVDQIGVLSNLLKKLLVPADQPFTNLADEAAHWRASIRSDWEKAGKPCDTYLVDLAFDALGELTKDETGKVLLHQDLHGHNVLSANREPWLVIDPKPLVGDPAFALSPIVRSFEFGHSKRDALYRLDRLSEELELDRERARLWTIAQTMAWAFESDFSHRHFETSLWLL
ncbi:aminoglycoside phosphotransferase family protein [uncultured Roseibium sp.]|uniref:aminoglycoside phosphotransferase family protein n=2 Tax=uncultured Roseibium sp. TaxID=1936171 RepID=UPI002633C465|nr:aminoglycoside phosphotransferase family protein [uncultured Roseibium sp.]